MTCCIVALQPEDSRISKICAPEIMRAETNRLLAAVYTFCAHNHCYAASANTHVRQFVVSQSELINPTVVGIQSGTIKDKMKMVINIVGADVI